MKKINRITIKVGTRVLTANNNKIDRKVIKNITQQIIILLEKKIEVILVSSGAIGAGLGLLSVKREGLSLSQLQAVASVGQSHLMNIYNEYFSKKGYVAGQLLLTQEDFNNRKRFLNIRYTINTLLKYKAVPIVNENDSITTEEIKCGDNDRLSSLVATLTESDMLIILTDVDGLYDTEGKRVKYVKKVNNSVKALCKGKGSSVSTGGMASKLEAVKNAAHSGIDSVIARGKTKNVILDIIDGKDVGTKFDREEKTLKARQKWIAFGKKAKGKIVIDTGAMKALVEKKKSLLSSGIIKTMGVFGESDVVEIMNEKNISIARGLSNYSSAEIGKIKGRKTSDIEKVLGYKDYDEVVHRDNLVVLDDGE